MIDPELYNEQMNIYYNTENKEDLLDIPNQYGKLYSYSKNANFLRTLLFP